MRRLVFALALLAAPASADDGPNSFACLEETAGTDRFRTDCIGMITRLCQMDPEFKGSGGAVTCMGRETLAWDGILNGQYKVLRAGLNEAEKEQIRAAQLAWVEARDAECAFTESFFYRYSGSASAERGAQCRRDRTAERAALLYDWTQRLKDF